MRVDRILHLYWRTKRKRVRKKNLARFGKWMEKTRGGMDDDNP